MKYQMNRAPMGWNSYDYYDTTVNEEQIKANADFMVTHMKDCGWEYIVVDIEWYAKDAGTMRDKYQYIPFGEEEIDEYGRLLPDVNRFPSSAGGKGFGSLAEYIHELGLKFGIHIMRGIPRMAAHRKLPVLGAEMTLLDDWTLDLLTRKDVLKLTLNAYIGRQHEKNGDYAIWSCLNEQTGEKYLAFFNFLETGQKIECNPCDVEQFAHREMRTDRAKELWSRKETLLQENILTDVVPAHGARLFELD